MPSYNPSLMPSFMPSRIPSRIPSFKPSSMPTFMSSLIPSFASHNTRISISSTQQHDDKAVDQEPADAKQTMTIVVVSCVGFILMIIIILLCRKRKKTRNVAFPVEENDPGNANEEEIRDQQDASKEDSCDQDKNH
eukprot:361363_1